MSDSAMEQYLSCARLKYLMHLAIEPLPVESVEADGCDIVYPEPGVSPMIAPVVFSCVDRREQLAITLDAGYPSPIKIQLRERVMEYPSPLFLGKQLRTCIICQEDIRADSGVIRPICECVSVEEFLPDKPPQTIKSILGSFLLFAEWLHHPQEP